MLPDHRRTAAHLRFDSSAAPNTRRLRREAVLIIGFGPRRQLPTVEPSTDVLDYSSVFLWFRIEHSSRFQYIYSSESFLVSNQRLIYV